MSSFNLLSTNLTVKDGSKKTLEELLSQHSYERIYLMLGINELGYPPSSVTKKYASIVDWIHQLQPQARIILEANLHVTKKKSKYSVDNAHIMGKYYTVWAEWLKTQNA